MTYKEEELVKDNIKQIAKETLMKIILCYKHICSYINGVLSTRKNDEQNAFGAKC